MKNKLDWQKKAVVKIYNEVNLWSAPFGRLLLENIPMQKGMTVLDLGFGTGFPLVELSQRFGETSVIYGVDIWEAAIALVRKRIKVLGIKNIIILEESANHIGIPNQEIDLITSNLGVNNFEDKETVYKEIHRILRPDGRLCITTNPIGTFEELFHIFDQAMAQLDLAVERQELKNYIQNRETKGSIVAQFRAQDFELITSKTDQTNMRFTDAEALLDHSLIRIGFRAGWEKMVPKKQQKAFFDLVKTSIEKEIQTNGSFTMSIPMLYLEFKKT